MQNRDQQLNAFFDGQLSESEFEALCNSMKDDAELAAEFTKYSLMEGHICCTISFSHEAVSPFLSSSGGTAETGARSQPGSTTTSTDASGTRV